MPSGLDVATFQEESEGITVETQDYWVEDAAADMLLVTHEDEDDQEKANEIAAILRQTIGKMWGGVGVLVGNQRYCILTICFCWWFVSGSVKMPKYRKKGAGIPRIENVVLYKNRIGDSGAEAFAEGKKKTMSLDRVLCFSVGRGWSTDASVVLFVVVVAVVVACCCCL